MAEEDKINEVVEQPLLTSSQTIYVHYHHAKLFRRIMANFIDILILTLFFFCTFMAVRAIIMATPEYQKNDKAIYDSKINSCLYEEDFRKKQLLTVSTIYNDSAYYNVAAQYDTLFAHIEGGKGVNQHLEEQSYLGFFPYLKSVADSSRYQIIYKDYTDFRLNLKYSGINCFVLDGDNVVVNPVLIEQYPNYKSIIVSNCYVPYIDTYAINVLAVDDPNYLNSSKYISNMLFFVEFPISITVASILTYLVPIFIFRRGRKTFGKALYYIGKINTNYLNPGWRRMLIEFLIVFVGEIVLSFFTFGIPIIISFTMMVFSKQKQSFPDYMLGLFEVDTSENKIFYSKEEILLNEVKTNKTPVNFKTRNFD